MHRQIRQRKQPLQDRAQVTQEALLEATLQVLRRHGLVALTTTRVAKRAGVSVGTLYQYYPDKAALVTALHVRYVSLLLSTFDRALAQPGASTSMQLRHALEELLRVKRDNLELAQAMRGPLGGGALFAEALAWFVAVLTPQLQRMFPGLSEQRVAIVVAMIDGALGYAVTRAVGLLSDSSFVDDLVAIAVAAGERSGRGAVSR